MRQQTAFYVFCYCKIKSTQKKVKLDWPIEAKKRKIYPTYTNQSHQIIFAVILSTKRSKKTKQN